MTIVLGLNAANRNGVLLVDEPVLIKDGLLLGIVHGAQHVVAAVGNQHRRLVVRFGNVILNALVVGHHHVCIAYGTHL